MSHLPGQLRLTPAFPFAGRVRELAVLRGLVPLAHGDGLRVALVGGEAGSGKSRLVREVAHHAAADGAHVLYGACDPVVRRPYGPFAEVLAQLVRSLDDAPLRSALGAVGGELTRLLPDLGERIQGLTPPVIADPDTERHRLHSAMADLLVAGGAAQPLLIVVEDAHWADTPTLLLLRQLVRDAAEARALVIATFRDTEAEVPEPLTTALVDLRRSEAVVRLRLGGLTTDEISQFVQSAGGDALGADPARAGLLLHELTGGNAFLLTELWRTVRDRSSASAPGVDLAEVLTAIGSPDGVREVVADRLARLDPATGALLEVAAVVGSRFSLLDVSADGLARSDLAQALEQAVAHGMIEEVPARSVCFRFTHELVRRALYDRLPPLRRAQLHLAAAERLERRFEGGEAGVLAELAHHFTAAAGIDGPGRAATYSLLAGRAASRALDFDEAAARLSAALKLGIDDPHRRAEIQLELGAAESRGGRADAAIAAFTAVAQIARQLDDPELLARAAVGLEETCWRPAMTDAGTVRLLEEALAKLGPGDSELRVRVLAGLSRAHALLGDYASSVAPEREAVTLARRLGDHLGLATVLMRSYWSHGQVDMRRTLDMLGEAVALAEELEEIDLQAEAREWRVVGLSALGDLAAAQRELAETHALAARMRQPFPLHVAEHCASMLALSRGDLDEAEAAARRSHEWSRLLTGRRASGVYGIQMFSVRREQGRLAELAAVAPVLARTERTVWRPGFALMLAELGMDEEARAELAEIRRAGFDHLRASLWVASLTYLADACALVGDAALAALVYPELAPLSGGNIVIGHGVACYGAADRFLGLLASTFGDHDLAIDHYERALAINRRMGADTWTAHTLYAFGRTLMMRGSGGEGGAGAQSDERVDAAEMLAEAATLAGRIGMPSLLARARALGAEPVPDGVDARARALGAEPVPDGADALPAGADGLGLAEELDSLPGELSWREVEVLRLIAAGLSNREIGQELYISGHTVANHVRSILRKTGAANRTEAAGYAYRHALVARPVRR